MKKTIIFLMVLCMAGASTACGSKENGSSVSQVSVHTTEETVINANESSISEITDSTSDTEKIETTLDTNTATETTSNILIAYFTYAENADLSENADASASASIQPWNDKITGNTGVVADMISQKTGGELFSIRTVKTYPSDYDATIDEGQAEKSNDEHPELATHIENFDNFDTVFVGFPNWWYGMPMAMYSFFEEYDFSGKTIVPFCTSGGSGFSDALDVIAEYEPDATILNGLSVSGSNAVNAENDVSDWINELELNLE